MSGTQQESDVYDLFVIGGGINGVGIARDATGRGLSVALAEMNDLASATSSASTKLFHGGLRYLEYFEINLVRHALAEREVLLRNMPHISWPMRFVLPYDPAARFESDTPASKLLSTVMPWMKGRRPAWLIRLGLFLYDRLGGRDILPATNSISLHDTPEGAPLQQRFERAFEYSDCWVEDARLVALNARDAKERGAVVMVGTKVTAATCVGERWEIETENHGGVRRVFHAKFLVNAAGPWVGDVIDNKVRVASTEGVRLVRGSHIVTRRLYDHDKCYFFQGSDGRIIFTIPYETDFTLIGTTDHEHAGPDISPECTEEERDYLLAFANSYFRTPISADDVVWSYSGVRPLYDDGASSATAATREYILKVNDLGGAPVLNVFGGKITTYRKLAEDALKKISAYFPDVKDPWTSTAPLPGGDFHVDGIGRLHRELRQNFPFLSEPWARRLVRAYGTDAAKLLEDAKSIEDLGPEFGATLTGREVDWLMKHEFARTSDDVLWRRSKLGLRLSAQEAKTLDNWMQNRT